MTQDAQGTQGIGERAYTLRCSGGDWQAIANAMGYREGREDARRGIANAARHFARSQRRPWPVSPKGLADDPSEGAMRLVSQLETRVAELEAGVAELDRHNSDLFRMLTETLRHVRDLREKEMARSGAEREAAHHVAMTGRIPRGLVHAGVG
ncbi:MAG: hypothetical protein OXD40_15415 [bacterium]|nr:hypothetical protein [bacterium]